MKKNLQLLMTVVATVLFGSISMAQCPGGQGEVTVEVTTDPWGYENYWEVTPQGNACGVGTVGSYGNPIVGCLGEGLQVAALGDAGAYGDNGVFMETVGCFTFGDCFTIHNVDDFGDAAAGLNVMVDGVTVATITGGASVTDFCLPAGPPAGDDISVSAAGVGTSYLTIPLSHATALTFEATITNNGANAATNAYAAVLVNTVATDATATTASLAAGASATTSGTVGFTATSQGMHDFDFVAMMDEVDGDATNDMMTVSIMYSDTVLGRDNGTQAGALGIGAPNENGVLGQTYMTPINDVVTSVSAYFVAPTEGDMTSFTIWDMAAGLPNAEVATTADYTFTAADAGVWITLPLVAGYATTAGTDFIVVVNENANNVSVGTDLSNYEVGTNWVNWDTNPNGPGWSNGEDFGFAVNYMIRANFAAGLGASVNDNFLTSANVYPNPTNGMVNIALTEEVSDASIVVYSVDGTIVSSDVVSGTQFSVNLEGLTKGMYIIELNNGSNTGVYRIVKD